MAECLVGGADALICLGAMPFAAHHIERQENILASIAARYRIPTVFVNHAGALDGNVFPGMSSAFDHTGGMMAPAIFLHKTWLCSIWPVKEASLIFRPTILAAGLESFWFWVLPATWKTMALIMFALAFLAVDSAVVAAIAVEALGKEHVTGIFMPSPYTSQQVTMLKE